MTQKKKNPLPRHLERYSGGEGTSDVPSDTAFWEPWPSGDEAWAWIDAVAAADRQDPAPLIQLLAGAVPERGMPFVKDLLNRKLGKPRKGPKIPLWSPPLLEALARQMRHLIKNHGMPVKAAAEEVLSWSMFSAIDRDTLINHYTGRTGYGRRLKKKGR